MVFDKIKEAVSHILEPEKNPLVKDFQKQLTIIYTLIFFNFFLMLSLFFSLVGKIVISFYQIGFSLLFAYFLTTFLVKKFG